MNKEIKENRSEIKEAMSFEFWHDIFEREDWSNSVTNVEEYVEEKAHAFYEDKKFMIATYKMCETIASAFASNSCVCSEVTKIFDDCRKWKFIAFGWGDPHITSSYGYAYFDFTRECVFIDTNDDSSKLYTFDEIFKIMYS